MGFTKEISSALKKKEVTDACFDDDLAKFRYGSGQPITLHHQWHSQKWWSDIAERTFLRDCEVINRIGLLKS